MDLFYIRNIENNTLSLSESKHCVNSLRKQVNDEILITDGHGSIYSTRINQIKNGLVYFEKIHSKELTLQKVKLEIAIALTKNKSRFEWFLEKSTELGINSIYPLICQRSERKKINIERCEKILISAMKQSQNSILPQINKPINFQHFLEKSQTNLYIAHCHKTPKKNFFKLIQGKLNPQKITVMIGPEGDFTLEEVSMAEQKGATSVILCKHRLRTETAGIYVANCMQILF